MIVTRPLGIGEIFDRAVTLVVRRWRTAGAIGLLGAVPETAHTALLSSPRVSSRYDVFALLLQFTAGLAVVYTLAALAMLYGGDDPQPNPLTLVGRALASFWRLLRTSILTAFLLLLCGLVFGFVILVAAQIAPFVTAIAAIAGVLLIVPPGFVLQLAFTGAALEGTGATRSVGNAFARTFGHGLTVRTLWLAYGAVIAVFGPQLVVAGAAAVVAALPGLWWVALLVPAVNAITSLLFFAAVCTVAAIDYRVRAEGADLEALLDAAEPA